MIRIALICPTYNAIELHRYTVRTLTSFFETTPDGIAIVVDDGSAGFIDGYGESLHLLAQGAARLHTMGFPPPVGLREAGMPAWRKPVSWGSILPLRVTTTSSSPRGGTRAFYTLSHTGMRWSGLCQTPLARLPKVVKR